MLEWRIWQAREASWLHSVVRLYFWCQIHARNIFIIFQCFDVIGWVTQRASLNQSIKTHFIMPYVANESEAHSEAHSQTLTKGVWLHQGSGFLLIQIGSLGSAVNFPSLVWDKAPSAITFFVHFELENGMWSCFWFFLCNVWLFQLMGGQSSLLNPLLPTACNGRD